MKIADAVVVDTYRDALNRIQWRVTGPGGRFLITHKTPHLAGEWEVWCPDSLRTAHRNTLDRAIEWAKRRAEYPS